jgi:hypothetical protein
MQCLKPLHHSVAQVHLVSLSWKEQVFAQCQYAIQQFQYRRLENICISNKTELTERNAECPNYHLKWLVALQGQYTIQSTAFLVDEFVPEIMKEQIKEISACICLFASISLLNTSSQPGILMVVCSQCRSLYLREFNLSRLCPVSGGLKRELIEKRMHSLWC